MWRLNTMTCTPRPGLSALLLTRISHLSIHYHVLTFHVDLSASSIIPGRSSGFDLFSQAYHHSWLVVECSANGCWTDYQTTLLALFSRERKGGRGWITWVISFIGLFSHDERLYDLSHTGGILFSCAINEVAKFENRNLGPRLAVRTLLFHSIWLKWENSKPAGLQTFSLQWCNLIRHGGKKEISLHTSFDGCKKSVQITNRGPFVELK